METRRKCSQFRASNSLFTFLYFHSLCLACLLNRAWRSLFFACSSCLHPIPSHAKAHFFNQQHLISLFLLVREENHQPKVLLGDQKNFFTWKFCRFLCVFLTFTFLHWIQFAKAAFCQLFQAVWHKICVILFPLSSNRDTKNQKNVMKKIFLFFPPQKDRNWATQCLYGSFSFPLFYICSDAKTQYSHTE